MSAALAVDGSVWAAVITLSGSIVGGALIMAWRLGTLSTKVEETSNDMRGVLRRLENVERQMLENGRIMGGRRRTDPKWPNGEQ